MDTPINPSWMSNYDIKLRNKLIVSTHLEELDNDILKHLNILFKIRSETAKLLLSFNMNDESWNKHKDIFIYYNDLIKNLLGI